VPEQTEALLARRITRWWARIPFYTSSISGQLCGAASGKVLFLFRLSARLPYGSNFLLSLSFFCLRRRSLNDINPFVGCSCVRTVSIDRCDDMRCGCMPIPRITTCPTLPPSFAPPASSSSSSSFA
jgi:hypothetical protein